MVLLSSLEALPESLPRPTTATCLREVNAFLQLEQGRLRVVSVVDGAPSVPGRSYGTSKLRDRDALAAIEEGENLIYRDLLMRGEAGLEGERHHGVQPLIGVCWHPTPTSHQSRVQRLPSSQKGAAYEQT